MHLNYYELIVPCPYMQSKDRDSRLYRMRKLYGFRVGGYDPNDIFKSDYIKAKQKPVVIWQTKEKLMTNDHGGETVQAHREREVLFPYKRGSNNFFYWIEKGKNASPHSFLRCSYDFLNQVQLSRIEEFSLGEAVIADFHVTYR